jgi:hypothetical protein
MDYPDWAPERPRSLQIYTISADGTRVYSNLPDKLLTDLRMESVWRTLKRHANGPDWEGRFIEVVDSFFRGPRGFDTLSNQEAVKKGVEIIATARDLRAKLVDIGLNYTFLRLSRENFLQEYISIVNLWRELEKCGAIHGGATDTGVSPSWGRAPCLGRSYRIVG